MSTSFRVRCDSVNYRAGFVELIANIHPGMVNLETWQIHPDVTPSGDWITGESIGEDNVTGNVELELTPHQAKSLAASLIAAANLAESAGIEDSET